MNTPRTDAFEKQRIVEAATNDIATEAWSGFARLLERENERLREALELVAEEGSRCFQEVAEVGYSDFCYTAKIADAVNKALKPCA